MEPIWLDQYSGDTPKTIDLEGGDTLIDTFKRSVSRYAERPAFSNFGRTMSFAELESAARGFAAFLQSTGLVKGDRIAIMMPNLLQYPVALFGAMQAGFTIVNTNPLYTPRELRHQLVDSGAKAIVVLENFAHVVEEVIGDTDIETVVLTRVGDLLPWPKKWIVDFVVKYVRKQIPSFSLPGAVRFNDALSRGSALTFEPPEVTCEDVAFLQYTGGTTGLAKGAELTHGNMYANVEQCAAWLGKTASPGTEIVITALPLYHIFALTANCMTYMRAGGMAVLITNPRDMPGFVKELARFRFTAITGVNTLYNGLLNTPGFEALDFSGLKVSMGGGMAVQRVVAERWKAVTGCTLVEAYGLTETCPAVCINPLDIPEYNGAIGLPIPNTEVRIVGEDGAELGVGEPGELCVRGPQVMRGYWQRPEETAAVLSEDGWLKTGDVARIDEKGFVYIVDRKKDMILVSGFNVFPNEIEEVVSAHPGVLEVGAIGVPDEHSGEAVKIVVVKRAPDLDAEALSSYCREQLTGYKRPRHIEFVDELPKSNVGKILRRELRELHGSSH